MGNSNISEGMLDVFIYESETLLENMEALAMDNEDTKFDEAGINEIFRSMHTIKGSSAIMMYQNITTVSHKLEDIFYFIRESHPQNIPQKELVDRMLDVSDFIKGELSKIKNGAEADGDETALMEELDAFLEKLKGGEEAAQEPANEPAPEEDTPKRFYVTPKHVPDSIYYLIRVYFKQDTDMANIKAYTMVYSLKESVEDLLFEPSDIMTNEKSAEQILSEGFVMMACTKLTPDEIMNTIDHVGGTSSIELDECSRKLYEAFANDGLKALENAEEIEAEAARELVEAQAAKEAEETASEGK
ncbi:MAG: Hpt domain-containing protein, partial [Lachnospiraceae bacterium]|nr:Hpt domain-containing protein [Lachnospiraceae bacterium]